MRTTVRHHFEHVDSTQRLAIVLARAGAPFGTVVVADSQDEGRGRLDHRWESPEGGLYLSLLVPLPPTGSTLLPLAMGTALAHSLEPFSARPLLKWPNDLLVLAPGRPPRKLAGILADVVQPPHGPPSAVIGVGVNVRADPRAYSPAVRERVVQLAELAGRPLRIRDVERAVVPALSQAAQRLASATGRAETLAECRERLFGRGHPVRVDGEPAGILVDLDDDGALVVARDGEHARVVAGELSVEVA